MEWKDGTNDCVPIKNRKQYNPVKLTEYVAENEIIDGLDSSSGLRRPCAAEIGLFKR